MYPGTSFRGLSFAETACVRVVNSQKPSAVHPRFGFLQNLTSNLLPLGEILVILWLDKTIFHF